MRLSKLTLTNFQSHETTVIEFNPNFNCIVGPSNVGKTAIFNALAFLFLNEWDSDFMRYDADRCAVCAELDDGTGYTRTKSKTINRIELIKNGLSVKKWDNFGTEYPQEIQLLFSGMVEDLSVCFGYQDHNSFLIHEVPAVRGRAIMHLSGVSILDKTATDITAEEKEYKAELQGLERKKQQILSDMHKFSELDKVDKLIDKYTELAKKYDSWVGQYNAVVDLYERMEKTNTAIQDTANLMNMINIDADKELLFIQKYTAISELNLKFMTVDLSIDRANSQVETTTNAIQVLLSQLVDELSQAKQCPLCGGDLSAHSIDYIFKEFGL